MRTIFSAFVMSIVVSALFGNAPDFSQAETNRVARRLLYRAMRLSGCHTIPDEGTPYDPDEDLGTWHGFLGVDETNGWTVVAKKAAFDWYLSTLGSCDCRLLSRRDKLLVLNAVEMCGMLAYTNAVPYLKALAYNANGIYREEAIKTVLNFSSVDDATTMFIEGIVTNDVKFGMVERGDACGVYAHNIMTRQATNDVQRTAKERAWKMPYRHRMLDLIGTGILDSLFVSQIQGYESSSNRLVFAEYVLSHPDSDSDDIRRFTSVTNQLLSSGQPLPWIEVDDGGGN